MWAGVEGERKGVTSGSGGPCSACGLPADPLGDHALCCSAAGIWRRHNAMRDVVNALSKAGLACYTETTLSTSDLRPADIYVSQGWSARPLALDLSVVHPLSASHHHSKALAGTAAEARGNEKIAFYGQACESVGWEVIPLVAESCGAWDLKAQSFFSCLTRKQARSSGA